MGEAGGENMEMDSIQKVAGAEQESQERREAAAAESRRTVAEARKAAEELLEEARRLGLKQVLVTCDAANEASRRTIRTNGGVLDGAIAEGGRLTQRYWIAL